MEFMIIMNYQNLSPSQDLNAMHSQGRVYDLYKYFPLHSCLFEPIKLGISGNFELWLLWLRYKLVNRDKLEEGLQMVKNIKMTDL